MTFANPIPWWAIAAGVLLFAASAWCAYRRLAAAGYRRHVLAGLRFATLFLLLVFLLRPVLRVVSPDTHDAIVPVLVDTSRSMGIEDADGLPRIDSARDLLDRALLPALSSEFTVELLAFGDGVAPVTTADLSASARRSDLASAMAALRERYRNRPVAGIVVVSDGGDTSGRAEREVQRERTPPIHPIGIGSPTAGRDREVLSITAAEAVLEDSRVDLAVSAVSHGHGTDPIELRLLENGRPIEVRRAAPAADGVPVRVVFQIAPRRGAPTLYTVEIPEAAGEVVPENNTRSVLVQQPSRPRRVLLVEGAPGFEHGFLKRAWAGDAGLDVDAVVRKGRDEQGHDTFYIQAAETRSGDLASGFPQRVEDLFTYDAVVLANVEPGELTDAELEATRDFVGRRGGGLLVLGARSFLKHGLANTPIGEVLPLDVTDRGTAVLPASLSRGTNRAALTEAGAVHPVMQLGPGAADTRKRWDAVPSLAASAALGGPRPGATVLAVTAGPGGAQRALVAVQRYGEGRSMVFTGEASWRWRMMLPSTDRSYETFWRQAIRWLAVKAADPISITSPAGSAPGDALHIGVAVRDALFQPRRDAGVTLRIAGPDGRLEQPAATLSRSDSGRDDEFGAAFTPAHPGIYRITAEARRGTTLLGSASTALLVGGSDLEMTDPRLNTQLLERLASASGGHVTAPADVRRLVDRLRAGVPAARRAAERDLWHNGWSFAVILLLLGAEWILRRRWGLR
ncbi:MAG: hypothetical protein A3H96_22805 [Acidobacteria bacterium RIFCSPLOWO2_02_FULL_67_36]|nr:MAG: hypothetical protein A3H96_22805 [Acidobacteria bacterium RIFCSPLOWO2_02_FULL_67_36]OFW26365.1 MAG: hypothetical protein A3G21_27140 [Acidobacteria bacterium RIFCSPLOWO2_12_FULL_66_21]